MTETVPGGRRDEIADAVQAGHYEVDALRVADSILAEWSGRRIVGEWMAAGPYGTGDVDGEDASIR